MRSSLIVSGLLVALASCATETVVVLEPPPASDGSASAPTDPGGNGVGVNQPAPDASVRSTSYSGFGARRRLVVRDQATWDSVWTRFSGSVMPVPPAPSVDFATQMVVVASMGQHSSGGFTISIDAVSENDQGILVRVRESSPGRNCIVTEAFTSPATLRIVSASNKPLSFREIAETRNC